MERISSLSIKKLDITTIYNMSTKIFITGPSNIDKLSIAKKIVERNDDLSIGQHFSNDKTYEGVVDDDYIYYLSTQDIDLTYKNNFVLFVNTNNYISSGITMDSFYNDDIFTMSMCEFNNISDSIFKNENNDIVVIWLDTDYNKNNDNILEDVRESGFLQQRLNEGNIKYLYFFNEDEDSILKVIFNYLYGNEEDRKEILIENS